VSGFYEVDHGDINLHFHAGQWKVWQSRARFTFMVAGSQSGKTVLGPWWLERAMRGDASDPFWPGFGSGDYLAVSASYDLFKLKMLPEIRMVFEHILKIGRFWAGDKILEIRQNGRPDMPFMAQRQDDPMWARIILRSAQALGGLESATGKAAWLDECGMDSFELEAWEAILRRLSINQGPVLGTTTPYNFGWLKREVFDRWQAGDLDYNVVQFSSVMNPAYPKAEFERARKTMPAWKFAMMYEGFFHRPGNLIYADFLDDATHPASNLVADFEIPSDWLRYVGLDYGAVNTATIWMAENPDSGDYFVYRETLEGGLSTPEHVQEAAARGHGEAIAGWWGGSGSEDQQRMDWAAAGLAVREPPVKDVEAGIDRVVGLIRTRRLKVFESCRGLLDELGRYRRKVDRENNVTDEIADKRTFHRLDALRYVCVGIDDKPVEAAGAISRAKQYTIEG
jgi:hypothetical protein